MTSAKTLTLVLNDIRGKVSDKVAVPGFVKQKDLDGLNDKLETLTKAINKLSKPTPARKKAAAAE